MDNRERVPVWRFSVPFLRPGFGGGAMTAMDREATTIAASMLADARRSGSLVDRLPPLSRPQNAAEAYAIQLETMALMGDGMAGWKVAESPDYDLLIGILLRSRIFADGAAISSAGMAMVGVEAEIAFRFDQAMPPRERAYQQPEVEAATTAFVAIEIVDSRFKDYQGTPVIERAADFMSNGAFVSGAVRDDWRSFDLATLEASISIDGVEIVRQIGGHASGDPLVPAIALCNRLRLSSGIAAGQVVTTGSFTGLQFAKPDSIVTATFAGFGAAHCRFVA
jgi:2-keto-4-pentenoate hydratase